MRLSRVIIRNPLKTGAMPADKAALPIVSLAVPMVLEQIFRIFVMSADTFMLSVYSQHAVAGVGLVNQYIFFIQILLNMVCIGASIVLSQYLGANREKEAHQVTQASILLVAAVAVLISIAVFFGAKPLLETYTLERDVLDFSITYFFIAGVLGTVWTALNQLQATILRSYGHTKEAMYVTIIANIINVFGNAIAIYGLFGLPITGVAGVAASTVISLVISCCILAVSIKRKKAICFTLKNISAVPTHIYRRILAVGIPVAGENLSYNVSQIVIMSLITFLGTTVMSAHVYFQTISRFLYIFTCALGNAVQIKIGYFVGAKKQETAYKRLYQYQACGSILSLISVITLNIVKRPIIALFTTDPQISELVASILLLSFFIEMGRTVNLITISALKGAGDVRFPVFFGLASVWSISVAGSWLLGLHLGYGLLGIWVAIGTEECVRGIVMLLRWKSKRWMKKAVI